MKRETLKRLPMFSIVIACSLLLGLVLVLAGEVPFFSQLDDNWAGDYLGKSTVFKIGDSGCGITSMAMAFPSLGAVTTTYPSDTTTVITEKTNPGTLNKAIAAYGGFAAPQYPAHLRFDSSSTRQASNGVIAGVRSILEPYDAVRKSDNKKVKDIIDEALADPDKRVIVGLGKYKALEHYVIMVSGGNENYRVHDPTEPSSQTGMNIEFTRATGPKRWVWDAEKKKYVQQGTWTISDIIQARILSRSPRPTPTPVTPSKIAVTPPQYDDIGAVLTSMGYNWTPIQDSDLANYGTISQYDILFLNCSEVANAGQTANAARDTLRRFVEEKGGSIYASDFAYTYIKAAFPGKITFPANPRIGAVQYVDAEVVDQGLASYLGATTVRLFYDLPRWVVIDSVSSDTTIHLRGSFDTLDALAASAEGPRVQPVSPQGHLANKPLMVSFRSGKGKVLYTTFHNHAQTTEIERKLLEYLVLVPATAQLQIDVEEKVAEQSAQLKRMDINTINMGQTSSIFSFLKNVVSELVFVFHWPGSTLRVVVFEPDGSVYMVAETDEPPIVLPIPDAKAGTWVYQITAVDVPYDNYPYVVGIGEVGAALPPPCPTVIVPWPGDTAITGQWVKECAGITVRVLDKDGKELSKPDNWTVQANGSFTIPLTRPVEPGEVLRVVGSCLGRDCDVPFPYPVPIPEPATLLLLGSGLAGLAGYARLRRRKRRQ